jgi:Ca-activated chloride channel family protein
MPEAPGLLSSVSTRRSRTRAKLRARVSPCLPIALCWAAAGAAVLAGAQQSPDPSVFRSGVALVSLNVTVRDHLNKNVPDLEQADFAVFEDGVKQPLIEVSRRRVPLALSLLIDSSASMEDKLTMAQAAGSEFIRRLDPLDRASVIHFDSRVDVLQPFTSDTASLDAALHRIKPNGSTAMFNAVYIALRDLERIKPLKAEDISRQAIVLLSDGDDTSSLVPFEDVLDLAKRSHTSIYAIGIRGPEVLGITRPRDGDFVLRRLAQETGGAAFFPQTVNDLPRIYREVADELSTQYLIAYTPTNPRSDGRWRRVNVRVTRPECAARTRAGYYAPER